MNKRRILALILCMVLVISTCGMSYADTGVLTAAENTTEAMTQAEEKTTEATTKAEEKITEATTEAEEKTTEATTEAEEKTTEATTKAEEKITEATTKAEEKTTEATTEAEEKTTEATTKAPEETTEATTKAPEETTETKKETVESTEEKGKETEAFLQTMKYEDEDVEIKVTSVTANAIPDNAALKVTPIIEKPASDAKTSEEANEINIINNQYKDVEKELADKAENEDYDVVGFLAYDITFVDKDGKEVEPDGEVKVTMNYKKAAMPNEVAANDLNTKVTVMHLEESSSGQVKEVVDMIANPTQTAEVAITSNTEIKKAEFITDSFSVFTITWTAEYETQTLELSVRPYNISNNWSEMDVEQELLTIQSGDTITFSNNEVLAIEGYTFDFACFSDASWNDFANGTHMSSLKVTYQGDNAWKYDYVTEGNVSGAYTYSGSGTNEIACIKLFYNEGDGTIEGGGIIEGGISDVTPTPDTGRPDPIPVTKPDAKEGELTGVHKTAKVYEEDGTVNEANRKFEIELQAKSVGQEQGNISVVLVLDASGSMKGNGTEQDAWKQLQVAATNFIRDLQEKSEDNRVGIVWYKGGHYNSASDRYNSGTAWKDIIIESSNQMYNLTENNVNELITTYLNKQAAFFEGGTPTGQALEEANEIVQADTALENEYVILFTDGRPGHNSSAATEVYNWNCAAANRAYDAANTLIPNVNALYTIGYGTEMGQEMAFDPEHGSTTDAIYGNGTKTVPPTEHTSGDGAHSSDTGITGANYLSSYIASNGCAKVATNTTDISTYFAEILEALEYKNVVNTDKIVDTIDARFVLTAESKAALEAEGATVVENENGTTTITWENVVIPNESDGGWSKTFVVQAREEFIGGNIIPTNKEDSGIYLNEAQTGGTYQGKITAMFPQPSVNVKLLTPELTSKEMTVYKGDVIISSSQLENVTDSLLLRKLYTIPGYTDGKDTTVQGLPTVTLTTDQIDTLETEGVLVINADDSDENLRYTYTYIDAEANESVEVGDPVGYFVYTYKAVENQLDAELGEHKTTVSGSPVQKYQLEVKFVAYTQEQRASYNNGTNETTGIVPPIVADTAPQDNIPDGGTDVTEVKVTGTSTVNVIAGRLNIEKNFSEGTTPEDGDIFTFQVNKDNELFATVNITYNEGTTSITGITDVSGAEVNVSILQDLSRGEYTVSEIVTEGYLLDTTAVKEETNCYYVVENSTATFSLGNGKDGQNVIKNYTYSDDDGGTLGTVVFTNRKVNNNWKIKKISDGSEAPVPNAEFTLENQNDTSIVYTGVSGNDGIVEWKSGETVVSTIPGGSYILKETKAPNGFALSEEQWTIIVDSDGSISSITSSESGSLEIDSQASEYVFEFVNETLYSLPSTGSWGIYWSMMSGLVLMLAAAFIIYKNRCKEVLKK